MSESLKIIQVCDHVIKKPYEEKKNANLRRQEKREDEYLGHLDPRLMYRGDWAEKEYETGGAIAGMAITGRVTAGKADNRLVKSMVSSSHTSSLHLVFYGDNIELKGISSPDGGKVVIYIDDKFVAVVDAYSELVVDSFSFVAISNLDYGMHELRVEIEQTANPSSAGTSIRVTGAIIRDAFFKELLPYDYITHGEVVTKIDYVSQVMDGKIRVFKEGVDFVLYTTNKIKWLGLNRPHPDYPYYIEFFVQKYDIKNYNEKGCPRCYGLGWYGSLQDAVTKQAKKVTGVHKIAEDIMKIILTPIDDEGYGSNFPEMNKSLYVSPETVEDQARSEIHRIEVYYKNVQAADISRGAEYDAEDILYAISIDSVHFDIGTSSLNMVITVYNNRGHGEKVKFDI